MTEEYIGVLDRFEGSQAVMLLEADGETVDEYVLSRESLPEKSRDVDNVFRIVRDADEIVSLDFDEEETKQRIESVESQFDRLSERPD